MPKKHLFKLDYDYLRHEMPRSEVPPLVGNFWTPPYPLKVFEKNINPLERKERIQAQSLKSASEREVGKSIDAIDGGREERDLQVVWNWIKPETSWYSGNIGTLN
jgi:hypothetical protein